MLWSDNKKRRSLLPDFVALACTFLCMLPLSPRPFSPSAIDINNLSQSSEPSHWGGSFF